MAAPLKVLLVEDSADDAVLVERELRRSGFIPTVERVETALALAEALDREDWDILLVDYALPRFSALGVLEVLKGRGRDLPVIIVSGAIGDELAVEVMRAGAQDYIRKGNWARLGPAIERELQEAANRRARRQAEEERVQSLARARAARAEAETALAQLREANRQLAEANRRLQDATEATQQERDRLLHVVELLPEGIMIATKWGEFVLVNAMMREILGLDLTGRLVPTDEEAPLGERHLDGTPYAAMDLPMQRSLFRGEVVRGEQMLLQNATTGGDVVVLANSAPISDASGVVVEAVVVCQDITPLRDLERARDDFLASAAHDLKNPLVSVKGYAQLLRRRLNREPIPQAEWLMPSLDRIEAAATRMTQLISNLLDVARLKLNHPLDLDRQPTDLVALAQQVAEEQRLMVDRHRIAVEAEVPELMGLWDAVRLERVLRNLVSNAVKYSPDGGKITITVRPEATPEGDWVVVQVTDPGIGIPAADQSSIFEPFHRAANAVGRIEGTGVGLASAKQIVEQHGGTITLTSEEGQGSTFTFRLPLVS